jgi:hypothetical protein
MEKIASMYKNWTANTKYCYDLFEINDGEEIFITRFFDISLNEVVDILKEDNPETELTQDEYFEDWYYLSVGDSYYKIQLFQ